MIRKSPFKPGWWLSNPHLQTIWQTFFRRHPDIVTQRERLVLPDGDFIDLDWAGYEGGPIVLVLHGIAGNIDSAYAKGILRAIADRNWCGIFMHFRGCSGEPNRLPRWYHSGETADLQTVIDELRKRYPKKQIAAIGFSMGGNVLLKWLGETGNNNPLIGAVAVSVPYELEKAADHINKGIFRIYQWWLLREIRELLIKKSNHLKTTELKVEEITTINSFWDFDNKVTAPLHGFENAHDYYQKSSARQYLEKVAIPTLLLHSSDDPFMTQDVIANATELSPYITLELSDSGGHVGFIEGTPWKPKYWLETRIPDFLATLFKQESKD